MSNCSDGAGGAVWVGLKTGFSGDCPCFGGHTRGFHADVESDTHARIFLPCVAAGAWACVCRTAEIGVCPGLKGTDMSVIPTTRIGKVEFYEVHSPVWAAQAAAVGLTTTETAEITQRTEKSRGAYQAMLTARASAKAATEDFYDNVADMASYGAGLMSKIRGFAESTANPTVYIMAQIPAPATPTPAPAPGKPMDFSVELSESGVIMLKWKCVNPVGTTGTIYEVRRRIGAGSPWTFLGATGVKSFDDDTLPAGSTGVTYEISAVRSTKRGLPGQFNVNFGVGGDGAAFARVENVPTVSVKMAA